MGRSVDKVNHLTVPTDGELIERLQQLMFELRETVHRSADGGSDEPLAPMEGKALAFFVRHTGATLTDLVKHTGRDKAQLARLVRVLLDQRFVTSKPDANDARVQRITPTASGLALYEKFMKRKRRAAEKVFAGFTADEKRTLLALLARMKENL